jgi:hypothetical protein
MLRSEPIRTRSGLYSGMTPMLKSVLAVLAFLGALASPLTGQEREIVFSQVTVAGGEAALVVEFGDGQDLRVSFREGTVTVNEEEVGTFSPGGPLDQAWRALLGRAVAMDNGQLGELLREWSAPSGLDAGAQAAARALEERFRSELIQEEASPSAVVRPQGDLQQALEALIFRTDRLRALTAAVRDLRTEDLRVHVAEDLVIEEGERLEGSLLVLDGHLTLDGEVEGDVILLGGSMSVGEHGRVGGDLRWSDADVDGVSARAVGGQITRIRPVADRPEADLREEIRREVQAAVRGERTTRQAPVRIQVDRRSVLGNIAEGIGRLFQTLVTFAILFGMGLAALYFFPRNFEVVARTARNVPGRSALVGLASGILFGPLWVVGIVLLAITIIGIPVLLLWIPLAPLAFGLAAFFGFLAVARNLGRWASDRHIQGFNSLDGSRPAIQLGAGLVVLLGAFAVAAVFQMGGAWLAFFHGILAFTGGLIVAGAMLVGLGATVLSRAGRDPVYAGPDWSWVGEEDPWAPEPEPYRPSEPGTPRSERPQGPEGHTGGREGPGAGEPASDVPPESPPGDEGTEGGGPRER